MTTANGLLFLQSLHYCTIASILMQSCITEDILKIWKKQQSVCSGNFEKKPQDLRYLYLTKLSWYYIALCGWNVGRLKYLQLFVKTDKKHLPVHRTCYSKNRTNIINNYTTILIGSGRFGVMRIVVLTSYDIESIRLEHRSVRPRPHLTVSQKDSNQWRMKLSLNIT